MAWRPKAEINFYEMNKYIITSLFIMALLIFGHESKAQSVNHPWAIGLHAGNAQYDGDFGNSLFDFDPFQGFLGISVGRYLSPAFDLEFRGQQGRHGHWEDDNITNSFLTDQLHLNLAAHYKFLRGTAVNPYLKGGLGFSNYSAVDGRGSDESNFAIPLGLGIDINLSDRLALNVQTVYGLNFGDEYDANTVEDDNDNFWHHSIGFKYSFGAGADADGDGIADKNDKCPNIPGPKELMGCPDTDMDGIADIDDSCPEIAGSESNNGCPEIATRDIDIMKEALYGVYFDTEKATIKSESYTILNRVVSVMKDNPYYRLSVQGHTDSDGEADFNLQLSKDRAQSVRNYLVSKGINASRINTAGYGETKPVSTNATEEGKALNRRVEFKLSY